MIEDHRLSGWPADVISAAAAFKQGNLIGDPPFFYGANLSFPLLSWTESERSASAAEGSALDDGLVEVAEDDRPPYGLITTQTCDLGGAGGANYPFFAVAPVYVVDKTASFRQLECVVTLDSPDVSIDGNERLVADLRAEIPLEKSVLAGRKPIESFKDERGYLELAEQLGYRRSRGAFADHLLQALLASLREFGRATEREDGEGQRQVAAEVEKRLHSVRMRCSEGTRLVPRAVELYVIARTEDELPVVREWFERWWEVARGVFDEHEMQLHGNRYADASRVSLALVEQSARIAFKPKRAF